MADVRTDNGSPERVALDLMQWIIQQTRGSDTYASKDDFLDLYAECRRATVGTRSARTT